MRMYLAVAYRNLVQAPRRSLLLAGALALATMLLVLLLALSGGLADTMMRSATALMSGHVNVAGFFKANPTDAFPLVTEADRVKRIVREHAPESATVIDRARGWARIVSESGSMTASLAGIDPQQEQRLFSTVQLASNPQGQPRGELAALANADAAMLFEAQARRLDVGVGDQLTLISETTKGVQNTRDVRVVAVAEDVGLMSNWTVFVSKQTLRGLYSLNQTTTGAIMVYLEEQQQAAQVRKSLESVLESSDFRVMEHRAAPFFIKFESVSGADWTGQKLDLTTWLDEIAPLRWLLDAIDTVSLLLLTVLAVIIVVGIINSMAMAVRERTAELGTLRAIGMERGQILAMVLTEGLMLGFVGAAVGAAGGSVLAWGIDALQLRIPVEAVQVILLSDVLHLRVAPSGVFWAVCGLTAVAGLATFWPAWRASRMQPVTAMHRVE